MDVSGRVCRGAATEAGSGGGGIEEEGVAGAGEAVDDVLGVALLRSARGPVGTFWYPSRGARRSSSGCCCCGDGGSWRLS
jgi:hypothetical protein